jgi:CO dehydrogenase maturation factor
VKIVVAGKGGAGKTTVAGTIARAIARGGHRVLAVDADVNPMLGISLGLGMDDTEQLSAVRQDFHRDECEREPTAEEMVERFGSEAPDGVRTIVVSRVDMPDEGCGCGGLTAHRLLADVEDTGRTVLGDMEAGIGVLARMEVGSLDLVLAVANPTAKSIEVARRAIQTAVARQARVLVVANRVRDAGDLEAIQAVLGEHDLVVIPEDAVIARADAQGIAPIDLDDNAPGVRALVALGDRLIAQAAPAPAA